jgi:hypothetical protein
LNHRYPFTVLHHLLHRPSPQMIVDAGPAHATCTVPTSAPREPVMSTSRDTSAYPPREPLMPPTRKPEVVQQREIPATPVPTPPPKRKLPPNKAPPPSQHRRFSRASADPERLTQSIYSGSNALGATYLINYGTSVSRTYDTSDIPYLVADPTFAPVFISNGIDSPLP